MLGAAASSSAGLRLRRLQAQGWTDIYRSVLLPIQEQALPKIAEAERDQLRVGVEDRSADFHQRTSFGVTSAMTMEELTGILWTISTLSASALLHLECRCLNFTPGNLISNITSYFLSP